MAKSATVIDQCFSTCVRPMRLSNVPRGLFSINNYNCMDFVNFEIVVFVIISTVTKKIFLKLVSDTTPFPWVFQKTPVVFQ